MNNDLKKDNNERRVEVFENTDNLQNVDNEKKKVKIPTTKKALFALLILLVVLLYLSNSYIFGTILLIYTLYYFYSLKNVNKELLDLAENKGVDLNNVNMDDCALCGNAIGKNEKRSKKAFTCLDGPVCQECYENMGLNDPKLKMYIKRNKRNLPVTKASEILALTKDPNSELSKFRKFDSTLTIGSYAAFDDNHKWLKAYGKQKDALFKYTYYIIDYDQILQYEILEDGNSIASGGVGRALVGGALFGSTGAIVGSATRKYDSTCESLKIKLTLKGNDYPTFYIDIICSTLTKDTLRYKSASKAAQDIVSKLQVITNDNNESDVPELPIEIEKDETEILRKYKALLDDGIITEEDYKQKKNQILGI